MITLNNKIEIIIPKQDNNGKEVNDKNIKDSIQAITGKAGGCTVTDVKGYWVSDTGLMVDNNANYEWYYERKHIAFLSTYISSIVRTLIHNFGQEGVSVKINGNLYIFLKEDYDNNIIRKDIHKLL